jgi:uncharacterized protein YkwD
MSKKNNVCINFTLFVLSFSPVPITAQRCYNNIPTVLCQKANTAKNIDYMSEDKKDVVLYMNLARINWKWFVKNIIEKHSDFTQNEKKSYVKSLISDLKKTKKLTPLSPSEGLTKAARYHAKDMGQTGKTGHRSSDGTDTFKRIRRFNNGNYKG